MPEVNTALVLSDDPKRQKLRELQEHIRVQRDQIAEIDLQIETLRDILSSVEVNLQLHLAHENSTLQKIESMIRQVEHWAELLAKPKAPNLSYRVEKLFQQRARAAKKRRKLKKVSTIGVAPIPEIKPPPTNERLKSAYRSLARRFHPDLAQSEEERVLFGRKMAQINELYHVQDVASLEAMAEQAKGGEVDDPNICIDDQIKQLSERQAWFETVWLNLREEQIALEQSSTGKLWRDLELAQTNETKPFERLKQDLIGTIQERTHDVGKVLHFLEAAVQRYNHDMAKIDANTEHRHLPELFDPYSDKRLVRLSQEALRRLHYSSAEKQLAQRIQNDATEKPHLLRLMLMTFVSELSAFPLEGLKTYNDYKLRFDLLGQNEASQKSFEAALVEADEVLEFSVRRMTENVAHVGLRFKQDAYRQALPMTLQSFDVRREFKRLLLMLGQQTQCSDCHENIFGVPLFRTRGLDDLRAIVCPACGHTLSSYWMPRGKDVQALLNSVYVDFEIVYEFTCKLARTSVATQLLPVQVEHLLVRDIKQILFSDLFDRYHLGLKKKQVELRQGRKTLDEGLTLSELESRSFSIKFTKDAPYTEIASVEMLRHRIRNRFRRD